MQSRLLEFDIIKEKMNDEIENIKNDEWEQEKRNTIAHLTECLNELENCQKITVDPLVETRKKGLFGKFTVLFKRLCRKIVAWYLQPVCDDQTRYNHQAYISLMDINRLLTEQIDDYKKQFEAFQEERKEWREMIYKLSDEIDSLKRDMDELQ